LPNVRHAEVEHFDAPIREAEQIVRLDVALNDAVSVGGHQHVEEIVDETQQFGDIRRSDTIAARPTTTRPGAAPSPRMGSHRR
jgi:hypothetical protein